MKTVATPSAKKKVATPSILVTEGRGDVDRATLVRITPKVSVATIDRWIHVWDGKQEVRVGPLTPDQAEKLAEDLGYDALE